MDALTACELWALDRADFLAAVTGHAGSTGIAQDVVSLRMGAVPGPA